MVRWEYCVIKGFCKGFCRSLTFEYFTRDGPKQELPGDLVNLYDSTGVNLVARLIAQLGEEGWEMVGCVNTDTSDHSIYFKRPLPDNS